ncbi:urease accessory protein UreE [Dyadobacter pollutisoli]|uniref:Urease accessory protein UreE n=1 Tax=Dyadobacter pollutisoli TaxID=2910158 RepID=A0A9E8NE16_9BACT|nr:urease accessory protein UreE [Dyadobacter pollutisoli]WAC14990.1 urease accessory protein UreE [Dyadobacter pollutisoli]
MVVKEKLGNLHDFEVNKRQIDWVEIEWFETGKRILHKKTRAGRDIVMKFLNETTGICQDDVLYLDESLLIVADILACDCVVVTPTTMFETASLCYEIGNKHTPLFYDDGSFLIPYEAPLFRLLTAQGYQVSLETRKLLNPLKTTVTPHANEENTTLFSRIMKLTSS